MPCVQPLKNSCSGSDGLEQSAKGRTDVLSTGEHRAYMSSLFFKNYQKLFCPLKQCLPAPVHFSLDIGDEMLLARLE